MARRRGSSTAVGFVVVLVVAVLVALGLFFGDRYAADRVEREAAGRLQSELDTPVPPSVDVEGWPFLTQVVGRHVRSVHVLADDLGTGGSSTVPVAHTDLVLTDITSDDWFQTMTARHAEGTARLDYAALGSAAGAPLTYAGNGRVQVKSSTELAGLPFKATVTGTPQLDAGAQSITLGNPEVSVAGLDLPGPTADAVVRALVKPIPVSGLPFGLRLSSLAPADDGLHVGLQGDGLQLTR
jgi:ribosomal protein S11